jgi:hypothetical protein
LTAEASLDSTAAIACTARDGAVSVVDAGVAGEPIATEAHSVGSRR